MKALLFLCFFVIVKSMAWSQTATAPASGNGTRGNPYRIASLENLYWLSQNSAQWVAGKYYIQTADIDASSTSTWFSNGAGGYYGFPCIGGNSQAVGNQVTGSSFAGVYDGQGFTIENLYMNRLYHNVALFGSANNGTFKNIKIVNANINVTGNSSSFWGNAIFLATGSATIDNVHVISGQLNTTVYFGYCGSLLGRTGSITATNCSSSATVNVNATTGSYVGGFIGCPTAASNFTNCSFTGTVTASGYYVGGFVGQVSNTSVNFSRCYSTGAVTAGGYAGGFSGTVNGGTFTDCYATGEVKGNDGTNGVGGFSGYNLGTSSTFTRCYATGKITSTASNCGGFGLIAGTHTYNNCFWDTQVSTKSNSFGSGTSTGVTGKTTAEMKSLTTFTNAGWDFTGESVNGTNDYWILDAGVNNGYPSLTGNIRVWNGSLNTDWTNSANWDLGILPSNSSIIQIKSGASKLPAISSDLTIERFDFNNMAHLVDLGAYTLTCNQVLNYGANRFIKTSGNGRLLINIANSDMRVFPVGNSTLNSAFITNNTGAADVFGIRVLDDVYANGSSALAVSVNRIGRTWDISKNNANAGSGINLVLNWNSGEEVGTMSTPALYHYASGWQKQTGTTASTATSLNYTGYTGSFSPFAVVDGASTLPVTWVNFSGQRQNEDVLLTWSTGTEEQTSHFTIQHSLFGNDWKNIGELPATGSPDQGSSYSFKHTQAPANINLYRIMVTDIGGKTSFSKVINILMDGAAETGYRLYPNPLRQQPLTVETTAGGPAQLRTLAGSVVWKGLLPQGRSQISLPKLSAGTYLFTLGNITRQVLIQ